MPQGKIAIVGAGVAGSTAALYLGQLGLDITLFEKKDHISSGPPYCHLHAGGNLYREISDEQCISLLKQSIDFARYYPFIVDYRPTVIVLPKTDKKTPEDLIPRLNLLQDEYEKLIRLDKKNQILGPSKEYYRLYQKEDLALLMEYPIVKKPVTHEEWMRIAIDNIDLENVQFPLVLVQEYGMNLFRYGAGLELALDELDTVTLSKSTTVEQIERKDDKWNITYHTEDSTSQTSFDYLINASGFRTGTIDDMIEVDSQRMVEFKSSYITKWEEKCDMVFPEIIFHGERGTPQGMAQFTPYPGGYFQLHGMTNEITLYDDGLVASTSSSAQPRLKNHFIQKIDKGWDQNEVDERTYQAIAHLQQFIPDFCEADVGALPLFGAQQIPGDDPTLRVAEVSFPAEYYARCEIVKVSSSLDMVDAIVDELMSLGYILSSHSKRRNLNYLKYIDEVKLKSKSEKLAISRGYPRDLANINVSRSFS